MESKNKAEEAQKNGKEILIAKYPHKSRFISRYFETYGRVPREFKDEYEKIIFPQELKKIEEKEKTQKISIVNEMNKVKSDENIDLRKEITEKSQKIEELTDTLKRLQAEFENHKKRTDKEKLECMKYAQGELMLKLLPVLDSFEIALKNTKDHEKFIKGMEMVYAQLYSTLEAEGLRPIKAVGGKFDPFKHEVLMKEESDKDEDIVLDELQKGYMLNDRVLRHSKVKISCMKKFTAEP